MNVPQLLINCGSIVASQNKSDSVTPYATVDLSGIDHGGKPEIKIISTAENSGNVHTVELSSPDVAEEVVIEEESGVSKNRRRTENAVTKSVQITDVRGFEGLAALKDKKMSVDELRKHINIPFLTEKLKKATKETGKVKVVIMKNNKGNRKLQQKSAAVKNVKRVQSNKNKGKNVPPKKKVLSKEYLSQPLENVSGPLYQMWNLDDNQWNAIKEDMKTFMKNTPYDPSKTFADVVKEFMAFRGTNAPIPLLQRDHRPDTVVSKFNYGICCVIPQCNNAFFRSGADWSATNSQKSFFSFPSDRKIALEWVRGIKRPLLKSIPHQELMTYRVCEDHFDGNDFEDAGKSELSPAAIPKAPRYIRKKRKRLLVCPTLEQIEERREQVKKQKELGAKRTKQAPEKKRESQQEDQTENSDNEEEEVDSDHVETNTKEEEHNDKMPLADNPILNMTSFDEAVFFESDNAQEVVIDETS